MGEPMFMNTGIFYLLDIYRLHRSNFSADRIRAYVNKQHSQFASSAAVRNETWKFHGRTTRLEHARNRACPKAFLPGHPRACCGA